MASSHDEPRGQVLLALDEQNCARTCLSRAYELARASNAELQVVRVVPGWRWLWRFFPRLAMRAAARAKAVLRATRFWLAGAYGKEPAPGHVVVRTGNFLQQIVNHSQSRPTSVIVLPPHLPSVGRVATKLALATGIKVMVLREAGPSRAVLAASDLRTPGFPVLAEASKLAKDTRKSLVSFHNVDPLSLPEEDGGPRNGARVSSGPAPRERLTAALRELSADSVPVIRTEIDPVAAIVDEARERGVDLIMVGAHERDRFVRLLRGSVASRVVQRARCSVMVAPLKGSAGERATGA